MHITLLVPAPFDTVSGGYEYDRRMVAGLRAAGHDVNVLELAGSHPLTDAVATEAARAAWATLPADTCPVIDGLALPAFAALGNELAARGAVGLIHHPTSLETGLAATDQTNLDAIERHLFQRLARAIVTSAPTAEQLACNFGVRRDRIAVVVPGTENVPRSAGSGGAVCHVLSVGTLLPRKGHDVLLRALARLFDLNWHLTIAGAADRDKVHADGLAALAEELEIADRVDFAGEVAGPALEALWQRADLFALATHFEGYGMAVAEALKRGLPVAVTAGGAAGALVPVEGGVVCPPGDMEGLSKAMRRLIFSPTLRRDMAAAAWQAGQALPSWESQCRAFADVLDTK
jgi:glycosyltransferase involved in cell wall biosynthesis